MEVNWFELSRLAFQNGLPFLIVNMSPENAFQPIQIRFLAVANDPTIPKQDGDKRA